MINVMTNAIGNENSIFLGLVQAVLQGSMEDVLRYTVKNRIALGSQHADDFIGRLELSLSGEDFDALKNGEVRAFESMEELKGNHDFSVSALDIAIARRFPLDELQQLVGAGYLPGTYNSIIMKALSDRINNSDLSDNRKRALTLDYKVFAAQAELKAEQARGYGAARKGNRKGEWQGWFK